LERLRLSARDLYLEHDRRTHALEKGLIQWRQMKLRRDEEIKKLRDRDRESKLETFLDSHFIAQANIQGITPALKAGLASFGIETAADIDEKSVFNVQGFGPKRTSRMLAWRRSVANLFTYVPGQGVDPQKLRAIHVRFATDRRRVDRDFQVALTDLREKISALTPKIGPALSIANENVRKIAQLRADIQALKTST
jgi:DNA-binding helix-hairpin-helix protein with protein kinase domain